MWYPGTCSVFFSYNIFFFYLIKIKKDMLLHVSLAMCLVFKKRGGRRVQHRRYVININKDTVVPVMVYHLHGCIEDRIMTSYSWSFFFVLCFCMAHTIELWCGG